MIYMINQLNNLPVITKEMIQNPTVQAIINGACKTIKIQANALKRGEKEDTLRYFASFLAIDLLETCDEAFATLMTYYIYRSEKMTMPFSVQYNFMFEYSACLSVLEGVNDTDTVMNHVFDFIGEYIELIFKVAILLNVAEGNTEMVDPALEEEEDCIQLECDPLPEELDNEQPILTATPVIVADYITEDMVSA